MIWTKLKNNSGNHGKTKYVLCPTSQLVLALLGICSFIAMKCINLFLLFFTVNSLVIFLKYIF